jgi:Molybdopterin-binding domain of aldehyde dehydrogenase
VARWEGDRLTVDDATQWPTMVRDCLATMFDVPENDVRALVPYMGGGFGAGNRAFFGEKRWPHCRRRFPPIVASGAAAVRRA